MTTGNAPLASFVFYSVVTETLTAGVFVLGKANDVGLDHCSEAQGGCYDGTFRCLISCVAQRCEFTVQYSHSSEQENCRDPYFPIARQVETPNLALFVSFNIRRA